MDRAGSDWEVAEQFDVHEAVGPRLCDQCSFDVATDCEVDVESMA